MAFARVILSGTLGQSETWSCGLAYRYSVDTTTPWPQNELQDAALRIAAIVPGPDVKQAPSTAVRSTLVRVEQRTDANVLVAAAEAAWTQLGSSGAGASKPPQTAIVFSLRTGIPGARRRGRIYWPALAATINPDSLRLTSTATTAYATQMAAYLDGIETALKEAISPSPSLNDFALAVYSPTDRVCTDVKTIMVGDVLDVQRRRRDKIPEAYASHSYP